MVTTAVFIHNLGTHFITQYHADMHDLARKFTEVFRGLYPQSPVAGEGELRARQSAWAGMQVCKRPLCEDTDDTDLFISPPMLDTNRRP